MILGRAQPFSHLPWAGDRIWLALGGVASRGYLTGSRTPGRDLDDTIYNGRKTLDKKPLVLAEPVGGSPGVLFCPSSLDQVATLPLQALIDDTRHGYYFVPRAQTQAGNDWGGQHAVNVNYQSVESPLPFPLPFLPAPSPASGEKLTCPFLKQKHQKGNQ